MRKLIFFLFLALAACYAQQDVLVGGAGTSPYTILARDANWAGSGPGNVSNSYIFHPVDPNEGFCLFVTNQNPSNSHSFTAAVFQTGDPSLNQFTSVQGQWFSVPTSTGFPLTVAANSTVGVNYRTTASAGIVVKITGNTGAGGSPDTANIFVVQTTASACGSIPANAVQGVYVQGTPNVAASAQFPVIIGGQSNPGGLSTPQSFQIGTLNGMLPEALHNMSSAGLINNGFVTPTNFRVPSATAGGGTQGDIFMPTVQVNTIGPAAFNRYSTGYVETSLAQTMAFNAPIGGQQPTWTVNDSMTNPTANEILLVDNLAATSSVDVTYVSLLLSCSAACEIELHRSSTNGTCTTLTPSNMNLYGGTRASYNATHSAGGNCTVSPTLDTQVLYDVYLAAGIPYTLDLRGLYNLRQGSGTIAGLAVQNVSSFTGTATVTLTLVEN